MTAEDSSPNPYESPKRSSDETVSSSECLRALRGPFLALLTLAGLQLFFVAAIIIAMLVGVTFTTVTFRNDPEQLVYTLDRLLGEVFNDPIEGIISVTSTVSCFFIFRGALSMRRRDSYSRAMMAAFVSCIPFLSPIIYFGIPFGIWALIVLRRPEVKAAFLNAARSTETELP
jgi:hypothetical protein